MTKSNLTDTIKLIAEEKQYGREESHVFGVLGFSTGLYNCLVQNNLIDNNIRDLELLTAACYLHDVGVKVSDGELGVKLHPDNDHNVASFKWCQKRLNMDDCKDILTDSEKALVGYCLLWHKGNPWVLRDDWKIDWNSLLKARLLGGILRVGDSLASSVGKRKPAISNPDISITVSGNTLYIEVLPKKAGDLTDSDLEKADKRKDLFAACMGAMAYQKIDTVCIRLSKP